MTFRGYSHCIDCLRPAPPSFKATRSGIRSESAPFRPHAISAIRFQSSLRVCHTPPPRRGVTVAAAARAEGGRAAGGAGGGAAAAAGRVDHGGGGGGEVEWPAGPGACVRSIDGFIEREREAEECVGRGREYFKEGKTRVVTRAGGKLTWKAENRLG